MYQPPPPTPGEVLRKARTAHGLTQEQIAEAIGMSRYSVNQIENGHRTITPESALLLGRVTNSTAEFWLNLQRDLDLYYARAKLGKQLPRVPVLIRVVDKTV